MSEWFENSDFWVNYAPIMFDSQQWAQASGTAEALYNIAGVKEGAKVLDVCCAVGRISVELALLGLDVTGVDITEPFLEAARESAADEGVKINFINQDMRTFDGKESYDMAVNVYNSFGYCDKIEDDMKIF